jgi:hypothetical protein
MYALEFEPTGHLANSEEMKRPIDEKASKLYDLVVFKQLRICNDEGCKRKIIGKLCKYGFPAPPKRLGYDVMDPQDHCAVVTLVVSNCLKKLMSHSCSCCPL